MESLLDAYADDASPTERPATLDNSKSTTLVSASVVPPTVAAHPKPVASVVAPNKPAAAETTAAPVRANSDITRKASNTKNTKTSLLIPPLPPPPAGAPDPAIEARIHHLLAHKGNASLNARLRESREFKNPDILEKLIVFCELNEIGTNYPPDMFNPAAFTEDDYYNKIADRQANLAAGTPGGVPVFVFGSAATQLPPPTTQAGLSTTTAAATTTSTASSSTSSVADLGKKRSSKWDIQEGPPTKVVRAEDGAVVETSAPSSSTTAPPTKSTSKKAAELKPPPEPEEPSKYRRFLMERQQQKN